MYKNVLFNPYGMLIDLQENEITDAVLSEIAMFLSLNGAAYTPEELRCSYIETLERQLSKNTRAEQSALIVKTIIRLLYEHRGVHAGDLMIDQTEKFLIVISAAHIRLRPNIKGLLGTLASRDLRLFALFSGQKEFALFELKFLAILNYFEAVHSTSEIGLTQMDKALFSHLLTVEKLRPGECLFASDRAADIECAAEASIDCAYIKNPDRPESIKVKPTYEIADGDFTQLLRYAV
jgi:Predicted hydrolase (HAD superfamily)